MNLKSIFQFSDPFEFLEHYYSYHKRFSPGFTYESFSLKAGIKAPNYLKQVIDRKKKITQDKFVSLSLAMNLSFDEQTYFEDLVNYHQAGSPKEKSYHKKKLERYETVKPLYTFSKTKNYYFIDDWYVPVLLLYLHGSREGTDVGPLAKILKVDEAQLQKVTEKLIEERFLRLEKKSYEMTEKFLLYESKIPGDVRLKKYLSQSLDLALNSFRTKFDKGKFHSQYFKIDGGNLKAYNDQLKKLLNELNRISDTESGEDVYLLNFQFVEVVGK